MFANDSIFATQSVNNPDVNLVVSVIALAANIAALGYILYRAKKLGVNPWTHEVFVGTKDFQKALDRRESAEAVLATTPKSATPEELRAPRGRSQIACARAAGHSESPSIPRSARLRHPPTKKPASRAFLVSIVDFPGDALAKSCSVYELSLASDPSLSPGVIMG